LHVFHALLPLAPRCGSVGDVFALLMYSFHAGLDVAGSSVFSSVRVPLTMLVIVVVTFLVVLACNAAP
jgi:hypothetical protein